MKRNDCSIVQDLLPLYIEDMLQPDTTAYVTDHLSGCEVCTAALGDLKAETAAPTPDAEEVRKGDQQAMKSLKKTLTTQNVAVCLAAFLFLTLLCSPLMGYAGIPWRVETIVFLLTAGPLCVTIYAFFRQRALSRNVTLAFTGTTLLIGGVPLYFLASFFYKAIYNTLFSPGSYRPASFWEWLGAWMPSYGTSFFLIPASVFGILLAVIVLRSVWSKSLAPKAPVSRPVLRLHHAALAISLLIVVLHLIPWQFIYHYSGNDYFPLDFSNLLAAGIPLYITAATALAEISSKKHAQVASVLSFAMPGYVLLTLLSHWNSAWSHPIYAVLLLVLSCLLTAIALQSIWTKLNCAKEFALTPDTAANAKPDASAPKAEGARGADQRQLSHYKEYLTPQSIPLVIAVVYVILHFSPWIIPQSETEYAGPATPYLLFTGLSIFAAAVMSFRREALSRNMALLSTGLILPAAWIPLYLFITTLYREITDFLAGEYATAPPAYRHDTLWSLLSAVLQPAFLLALLCGLLLTGIALHHIWRKAAPLPGRRTAFQTWLSRLAVVFSGCIILLHLLPLIPSSKGAYTLAFSALFYGGPLIYITLAAAFCHVRNNKHAVFATLLALVLPVYAALPLGMRLLPDFFYIFSRMVPDQFTPLYCIPFLILSLALSATAICSVWYKLKHQIKEK